MSTRTKLGTAGLKYHGHIRGQALDHAGQLKAPLWAELSVPRKFHVRDEAEDVIAILLHQFGGILKVRGYKNFWPRLHAHQLVRDVNSLLDHASRLLD